MDLHTDNPLNTYDVTITIDSTSRQGVIFRPRNGLFSEAMDMAR